VVNGGQAIINDNSEHGQTLDSFDARNEGWRIKPSSSTSDTWSNDEELESLGMVERQVVCNGPVVHMCQLVVTRIGIKARDYKVGIVGEFEELISFGYLAQVGRNNHVRGRANCRPLYNTRKDVLASRYRASESSAV
jgi:hypothetical protein